MPTSPPIKTATNVSAERVLELIDEKFFEVNLFECCFRGGGLCRDVMIHLGVLHVEEVKFPNVIEIGHVEGEDVVIIVFTNGLAVREQARDCIGVLFLPSLLDRSERPLLIPHHAIRFHLFYLDSTLMDSNATTCTRP